MQTSTTQAMPLAVRAVGPDADGVYRATLKLPPGLIGYKFIYDQGGSTVWTLDPDQGRRKYVGGVENSGVKVADCSRPGLAEKVTSAQRPSEGAGMPGVSGGSAAARRPSRAARRHARSGSGTRGDDTARQDKRASGANPGAGSDAGGAR